MKQRGCDERKRTSSVTTHSHSPSSPSSAVAAAALSSSSSTSVPPSSDWAQLPTELLSLVASYASYRTALQLMLVSHCLRQLLLERAPCASSRSIWCHYPPVTHYLLEPPGTRESDPDVYVGDDRFTFCAGDVKFVSSSLYVLRHIATLRIHLTTNYMSSHYTVTLSALIASLQHFTRLRSLELHCAPSELANEVAISLDSLSALTSLVLNTDIGTSDKLTASLHRLCASQLDHLTLSHKQLHHLVTQQPYSALPRLRSLTIVTPVISSSIFGWPADATFDQTFPPFTARVSTGPCVLSSLVCLEFLNGLIHTHLAGLLDAAAPPTFAAQLTHLALRVRWQDRSPVLPYRCPLYHRLYPSLTHVHVGVDEHGKPLY